MKKEKPRSHWKEGQKEEGLHLEQERWAEEKKGEDQERIKAKTSPIALSFSSFPFS